MYSINIEMSGLLLVYKKKKGWDIGIKATNFIMLIFLAEGVT